MTAGNEFLACVGTAVAIVLDWQRHFYFNFFVYALRFWVWRQQWDSNSAIWIRIQLKRCKPVHLLSRVTSVALWSRNISPESPGSISCTHFCAGLAEFVCWTDVFYSFCTWIVHLSIVSGSMPASWGDAINSHESWNAPKHLKSFPSKIKEIWFVSCRTMIGRWREYSERENWSYYYSAWRHCKVYRVHWNEIFERSGFVCCRYMSHVELQKSHWFVTCRAWTTALVSTAIPINACVFYKSIGYVPSREIFSPVLTNNILVSSEVLLCW